MFEAKFNTKYSSFEGQFPWMAFVTCPSKGGRTIVCGGSIITEDHILTAAHCAHMCQSKQDIVTKVGSNNRLSGMMISYKVKQVFLPFDSTEEGKNDIAILHLQRKLTFNHRVKAICFALGQEKLGINEEVFE